MMTAKGTPTLVAVIELRFWFAGCGDVELVGAMTEFPDSVNVEKLPALEEELIELEKELVGLGEALIKLDEELIELEEKVAELNEDELVEVSNIEGLSSISIVENGYGSSEVV